MQDVHTQFSLALDKLLLPHDDDDYDEWAGPRLCQQEQLWAKDAV